MYKRLCCHWQSLRDRLKQARLLLRRVWTQHRDRMAEESGYAEAFVAVTLAAAELITDSFRAKYAVHHLAEAYVSLLRVLRPPTDRWENT